MLRKLSVVAVLAIGATGLSGCAGIAFAGTGAPGFFSIYSSTLSKNFIHEQSRLGARSAEGCITSILGLITLGNAGITEAANKANISRVTHIDQKLDNILGVYARYCVVVYGD